MGEHLIAHAMIEDARAAVRRRARATGFRRDGPARGGELMPHETPLLSTIVVALAIAWVFGALAHRIKVSPLVGYLLAGIVIGPFTPGYVADQGIATELAEIGVILLMFGVGLHFSLDDLLSVRAIAIPGAAVQIVARRRLGLGLALWLRLDRRRGGRIRARALGRQHGRAVCAPCRSAA